MIDLFSDTVTKPSKGMLAAMAAAEVGDDPRGDDPTARALEERAATLLAKAAALILPTATMANQIAVLAQAAPGSEVLCHKHAHILNFEAGGLAANAGVQGIGLEGPRGVFTGGDVLAARRPQHAHYANTALVVVENTANVGAGHVWPDADFRSVVDACASSGLRLHLDGARLFNAAVACGREVSYWSAPADSVQICFSKGLGCPFGAVLAGSVELIARCRRLRQRLGGAMRQTGVLAAAMNYALDNNVERLADDHRRLAQIADALAGEPELALLSHETNMLYFRHQHHGAEAFAAALKAAGVWVSQIGDALRICTHKDISDRETVLAIERILRVCDEVRS